MTATPTTATATPRDLPGGVTAEVITLVDLDGDSTLVQLTAPDEPIALGDLLRLGGALQALALEVAEARRDAA